jgi:hypothetical protein
MFVEGHGRGVSRPREDKPRTTARLVPPDSLAVAATF